MERLAIISHNSFRAIGFHKIRSPSTPYGPAPQGSRLITLSSVLSLQSSVLSLLSSVLSLQSSVLWPL